MWQNKLTKVLGIEYPIIQAGMAGGPTTPRLVSAVSNAGGLGTLGAGYMSPQQIRADIQEIRRLTDRPFAVNLFIPEEYTFSQEKLTRMFERMKPYREELGILDEPNIHPPFTEYFEEQMMVLIEERVPVFSFTFGILSTKWVKLLKENQTVIIGTATTVEEGIILENAGVDLIVGQGSEAGGHRGTFNGNVDQALIGTMALIPQLVDALKVPVIAAGGIMDARGLLAGMILGAEGVQLGTAFLTCLESGAHPKHKEAILNSSEDQMLLTRSFSGKFARGIKNRFMEEMEDYKEEIPDYPIQNALTKRMRQKAAASNQTQYMSMWAGQAPRLSVVKSASQLVKDLVMGAEQIAKRI